MINSGKRNSLCAIAWIAACCLLVVASCADRSPEQENHNDDHRPHDESESHKERLVELTPEMFEQMTIRSASTTLRALPAELRTTGTVDFEQDRIAHVTPRIPGRVDQVRASLGATIRKGQALAVIDSIELGRAKADYLQAKAHERLARRNFERENGLYAERISSQKEMLAAEATHLESVARLRNTEETLRLYGLSSDQIKHLSYDEGKRSLLPIRAPLAGRVVEKHVTVGELVTPERSLFTIADLTRVWIWIDVYEQDLRNVHLDDDVSVEVDAYPNEFFRGKVSYISDQVDADTRTVRARIDVDNTARKLRPGMFARITLSDPHFDGEDAEPVLVAPAEAVQRDGDQFVVFVPRGERRFERRTVRIGRRVDAFVEILSGLDRADSVVVEGAFLLKSEASKEQMGAGHAH